MEASRGLDKGHGGFPKSFSVGEEHLRCIVHSVCLEHETVDDCKHFPAMKDDGLDWRPNEQFRALPGGQDLGFNAAGL